MTVRGLLALSCIILAVFMTSSLCADSKTVDIFELDSDDSVYESRFPLKFAWLIGDYDFDQIEEYIDEYYISYYKTWERYLIRKQREFASNFGLTNIVFKPDFKQYEDTKLVLSKSVWDERLAFRYIAPIGNMWKFDASIAIRPYRFIAFIVKGNIDGQGSAVIVINRPFGQDKGKHSHQKADRLVKRIKKLAKL